MKHNIKRILWTGLFLSLALIVSGCKKQEQGDATKLSFRAASEYSFLKSLDGKPVTINGYMATSSPVDGSFMFLMNLPYQSCPFCVPNTSQLSNTIEVYPKEKDKFSYTAQAIRIEGTLQVAEKEDEPFKDMYGYEFNYKIVDASYYIIQSDELSADMALWQKIAESDVINEIYGMYEYLNFLCRWTEYYVKPHTNDKGENVDGYCLTPEDVEHAVFGGGHYSYGYKEGYFKDISAKIRSVDANAFEILINNVEKVEALADKALKEFKDKNYTSEVKYLEQFQKESLKYSLNNEKDLSDEFDFLYEEFSNWLGGWEL